MTVAIFGSPHSRNKGSVLSFGEPRSMHTAYSLEEVLPLLAKAEAATKSGSWVVVMVSYEAAPAFDQALKTHDSGSLPLVWVAIFDKTAAIVLTSRRDASQLDKWQATLTRNEYDRAIGRIHDLIAQGDTYQVNYTFPLSSSFKGNSLAWYSDLCAAQTVEYCAYLDLGRHKILSLSPELFFERKGDSLRTKPMKGTVKRGRWSTEDYELAKSLSASAKERAENVMIVDLLRNDLGKVSIPGTVRVSKLFEVERYETLWQMTSTVESTLRSEVGLAELMAALFPCGSVTGAPKIRTMEIIRELEPFPRGVYTGTIGFLRPGGDSVFNVAIRTVVIDSETGLATFGVGGGITYDSTAEREYDECLLKSSFLSASTRGFQLLESLLLENGEFYLMARHIERMRSSAEYFGFSYVEKSVVCELESVALKHSDGRWKIRLLLSQAGGIESEAIKLDCVDRAPLRVALATEPVDSTDRFLFHKTTNRAFYNKALSERPDCDDVIFWNEKGEVTESSVANVVLPVGEELFTPPQASGLLAGTFRAELLAQGKVLERVIHKEEFKPAARFFLINSVHKWMPALLI